MIIVSGTKRAGTSMWMQILKAAGLPILGTPFPSDWGETIREANQEGFYESPFRSGIYYATNPDPKTGRFWPPGETRQHVVKVFASGMVRTDLAYVHRVIASMRSFREYVPSVLRLYEMERTNKREKALERGDPPETLGEYDPLPPALEWWGDNYGLLRDALIRRYPLHMISYASVLREPERVIPEALSWIGGGAVEPALRAVREQLKTQHVARGEEAVPSGLSRAHEELFDELFERVDARRPLDAPFIDRLNDAHDQLGPALDDARARVRRDRRAARERAKAARAYQDDEAPRDNDQTFTAYSD